MYTLHLLLFSMCPSKDRNVIMSRSCQLVPSLCPGHVRVEYLICNVQLWYTYKTTYNHIGHFFIYAQIYFDTLALQNLQLYILQDFMRDVCFTKRPRKKVTLLDHWGTTANWLILVLIHPLPFFLLNSKKIA